MLCNIRIQENISKHQVIIVDKVYEAETNKARMLINPYIVVIQQDEVLESYKLKHIKVSLWNLINVYILYSCVCICNVIFVYTQAVNSEAKEIVFNKESNSHYPGCYADVKRSACNAMAEVIPKQFSEV